jgi:hypothetical protein
MPKMLSVEELVERWENDKSGEYIQINPDDSIVYVAHGSVMETIGERNTENPFKVIRAWQKASQYWPNIWQVSDHGNVTLYTSRGKELGGLV